MTNLEKFLAFQNAADGVTVDDGVVLTDWEIEESTGEDGNQVARFSWTDGENDFSCILDEGGIAAGSFDATGKFTCEDHEGEVTTFRFLKIERIASV